MFCRSCGKENKDGARFCVRCGKPMMVVAQKTGSNNHNSIKPTYDSAKTTKSKKKSKLLIGVILVLLVLLIGGGVIFDVNYLKENGVSNEDNISVGSSSNEDTSESQEKDNTDDTLASTPSGGEGNQSQEKGSKITDVPISSAYADDRKYYGNSFENVSQGGTLVSYGSWIYYVNSNDDCSVWKMKPDGTQKTIVSETPAGHISIQNEWLYYRQLSKGYLCRFNLNTGADEVLISRNIYEPKVVGRYVYFEDASDDSYDLYRFDIDSSNEEKITDGVVFYCCVTDKRIFYLDTHEDRKGYSVDLDGNDKQLWYADKVGTIDYVDGVIYFTDYESGDLYSIDPNTNNVEMISKASMRSMNIYDGWVYFADLNNNGALSKMNLNNPEEIVILSTDNCELINVSGGWVQYHLKDASEDTGFYLISTSGGSPQKA